MLNKFSILFVFIFCYNSIYAQLDYRYLANDKAIPSSFLGNQIDLNIGFDSLDKEKFEVDNRLFENFQVRNNYLLKRLYNSGLIIYSGPVYNYVNEVANKIIQHDESLKGRVKVFVLLNSSVNAMTLNSGDVFVNIGMLAHLSTEAELAFVLCHEFMHYKEKHVFQTIIESNKVAKNSRDYELYDKEDVDLYLNKYSRENETDADMLGFKLFIKAGYKSSDAISLLDKLKFAEFPFENVLIHKTDFESSFMKLPESYFNLESSDINVNEFYNDTTSTHPNIGQRKNNINTLIRLNPNSTNAESFLVSKDSFLTIRELCRYELSTMYLLEGDYIAALYNSLILLKKNPNSVYLNRCLVKTYSYIQSVSNNNKTRIMIDNPKKVMGETQKIHYLLNRLSREELNAICLKKSWEIQKKFNDDLEIDVFTKNVTKEFVYNIKSDFKYFKTSYEYNDSLIKSFYASDTTTINSLGVKYGKGSKKTRKSALIKGSFAPYVMADFLDYKLFIEEFDKSVKNKKLDSIELAIDSSSQVATKKKWSLFSAKKSKVQPKKINNVILLDLEHLKFDERRSQPIQFEASSGSKAQLINDISEFSKMCNVEIKCLIPEKFSENDIQAYNDRALLETWLYDLNSNEMVKNKLNVKYEELTNLSKRYGTSYVGYMTSIGYISKKTYSDLAYDVLGAVLFTPMVIPLAIKLVKPNAGYLLMFDVYDLNTGKLVFSFKKIYDNPGTKDLIKSEMYNLFNNLELNEIN